jgi:transcriptional regulator with XRE-family HTH domain
MTELGKSLQQARIARGLTLEDCERDTRISKRYLDALEREDWKIFPAPVYSRAFMRTYAQYLGLDPAALMRALKAQEEPEIKPLPEIRATPAVGSTNWLLAGAVAAFLVVAAAFLYFSSRGGDDNPTVTGPVTQPTVVQEGIGGGVSSPTGGRPVGAIQEGIVPDLTGVRLEDAITALQQARLDYVIIDNTTAQGEAGIVSSQDPAAGTDAGDDTAVTLVVPRS